MGDVRNDEPILGPGSQNQRRTLWIMAAAGLFLLVVIGAAVVLYSPAVNKENENKAASSELNPNDGWNDDALKAVEETALSDGSSVSEIPDSPFESSLDASKDASSDVYSFDLDDMKPFDSSSSSSAAQTDPRLADSVFASDTEPEQTTIDLNKISSASSSVSAKNDFTAAQLENAKSASKDSARSSTSSSSASKSSAKSSSSSSAKSASSSKATSSSIRHAYWIQVGSFSDKAKADSARSDLEGKGYRNVSNSTTKENMYRVRIGPYAEKSEAENVLVKVVKIKGYEEAFVVDANAPRQK